MKAREIIHGGDFQPEEVAELVAAFEAAWSQMDSRYDGRIEDRAAARERLASIIVAIGKTAPNLGKLEARALAIFEQTIGQNKI